MDQHLSPGISHQRDGVLCVKYGGYSAIHRAVEFAFGRQNGYALTKNAVCKCSVRNLGKLNKLTVQRRGYSHISKCGIGCAVCSVVLFRNFDRIVKSNYLYQDHCKDAGNCCTDQYTDN